MFKTTTGEITTRQAWIILGISQASTWVFLCLAAVLPITPNSPAAISCALCLPVIVVLFLGGTLLSGMVLGGQKFPWKGAVLWIIDLGLLPLVIPTGLVLPVVIIAFQVGRTLSPWFGEFHGFLIGLEFGTFAGITMVPFLPFLWPVFHRFRLARRGAANTQRLALNTRPLVAWYVGATVLTFIFQPSLLFVIVFVASWVFFLSVHRVILFPRAPCFVSQF